MLAVDNFVISPEILKMILLNQLTLSVLFIVHICMHRFNGKICRFLFCVEYLFINWTGHPINWTLFSPLNINGCITKSTEKMKLNVIISLRDEEEDEKNNITEIINETLFLFLDRSE